MKKIVILLLLSVFVIITNVNAFTKVYNQSSSSMQKLALIEFAILPPGSAGGLVGLLNGNWTFKYYKTNSELYNELLGEKLSTETSLQLSYGSNLYSSPKYINLKELEIDTYPLDDLDIFVPQYCHNFINFKEYKNNYKLLNSDFSNESVNISKICNALDVEGVIICYFNLDEYDTMYLNTFFFDANGTLIKRIQVSQANLLLRKGNFDKTYLRTVDKLIKELNKANQS